MKTNILIIGGGISGLHTAYAMQKRSVDFILVEARERLGGRILSSNYSHLASTSNETQFDSTKPAYDLGPSWFWPGQRHMESLVHELKLCESIFHQQATGQSTYEDQQGNIQKGFFGISMEGTYRLNGGMRQFIDRLEEQINSESILHSTQATTIEYKDKQIITTLQKNSGSTYRIASEKVVIALPPRTALSTLVFRPALPESRVNEINSYATWMAGHAKILVTYPKPFWLEQGLSGDAMSQLGPLSEIHDASSDPKSNNKNGYALFGFVGIPGSYRKGNESDIRKSAVEQLVRLFGEDAANPIDVILQDWSQEEFTATDVDLSMTGRHAESSMSNYAESTFNDRVIWSGTETADHRLGMNGLLEGALEASKRTFTLLVD